MDSTKTKTKYYVEVWTGGLFQRLQIFNDEESASKYSELAVQLSSNTKTILYHKQAWSKP